MLAFLIFTTDYLPVVLVRQFGLLVAETSPSTARFPLLFRPFQFLLGVKIVAGVAGVFALLDYGCTP